MAQIKTHRIFFVPLGCGRAKYGCVVRAQNQSFPLLSTFWPPNLHHVMKKMLELSEHGPLQHSGFFNSVCPQNCEKGFMCAHCVVTFFCKYVCGSNFLGREKNLKIPGQNK